jgi:hypothetical protein
MTDLASLIEEAVQRDGLQELTVRVSRYGADGKTPECWHAIAKYRTRIAGPWGVGVLASPEAAIRQALSGMADDVKDTTAEEDIFG